MSIIDLFILLFRLIPDCLIIKLEIFEVNLSSILSIIIFGKIDFIDLILDLAISEDMQYSYLSIFCQKGGFIEDRDLFKSLYQIQLRKKLLFLITEYIKEVYVYDSYRYDNVLNIADVFSHCYERFCKIKMFHKNREFIMKTICEPILGVKA